jgi:hypothetical protein
MVASVDTARSLIPLLLYFGKETVYELSRNYQRNRLKSPAGDPDPYAIRGTATDGTGIRIPIEPTDGDWYECTLGSPEDVQSDCSTSQHVRPVTVAMIRERAGVRHATGEARRVYPARGRTAWRRVGPGQQPALRPSKQGPCTSNTSKKTFKPSRSSRSVALASFLPSQSSRYPRRALRCWVGRRGQ